MNKYLIEIKAEHDRDLGAGAKEELIARLEQVMAEDGFDQIDSVINGQGGEVTEGTIYRMSMGSLALGPNGIVLKSNTHDPAEARLGAPVGQMIVAQYSGDIIRSDGRHEQIGQIQICRDERRRNDPNDKTGVIKFFLRDSRRGGTDDSQMVCVFILAIDGPWLPLMPHMPGTPGMPT